MFVANEPRPQTGNTSSSLALRQQLNTPGRLLAEQRASDPKPVRIQIHNYFNCPYLTNVFLNGQ